MKNIKLETVLVMIAIVTLPYIAIAGAPTVGPITSTATDLATIIQAIITWLFLFIGVLATLFIIIGGILYLTSAGNAERSKQAKATLLYAIIGLLVTVLSYWIVTFVVTTLDTFV